MIHEYRTTIGKYRLEGPYPVDGWRDDGADDPEPPNGDGWRLVDGAAADGLLLWFWSRERES